MIPMPTLPSLPHRLFPLSRPNIDHFSVPPTKAVRKALRVSRELNSKEVKEAPDIGIIGIDLNMALSSIMKKGGFTGGELRRISRIFRKRVEDHRKERENKKCRKAQRN